LASVPTILGKVQSKWTVKLAGLLLLGVVIALAIVNLTPTQTPNNPLFLFFSGAMASMAMILPGISGSFILVLLGKYEFILSAVNNRDVVTLTLVAAGAAVGIILFSKVISYFLQKYHDIAVVILGGFVIGAITKIWPFKKQQYPINPAEYCNELDGVSCVLEPAKYVNTLPDFSNQQTYVAIGLMLLGAITIFAISKLASKSKNGK
jgi:putative membrane protein